MTKDKVRSTEEALRLAWGALEDIGDEWGFTSQRTVPKRKEAITAIKEALANEALEKMAENARELGLDYEPAQEPVAIPDCGEAGHADGACGNRECLPSFNRNTTSPQRKPLTDEEIQKCYETTGHYQTLRPQDRFAVFALARAIEAAHGIKGEA